MKRRSWKRFSRALGAVLATLSLACEDSPDDSGEPQPESVSAVSGVEIAAEAMEKGWVATQTVERAPFPTYLEVTGRLGVDENRTVTVGTVVEARVSQVLAQVGDRVASDQILAWMHGEASHEIRSDYAKAHADVERHRADVDYASKSLERQQRLYELKAVSEKQLQMAEAELVRARSELRSALAEKGRIEEALAHIGLDAEGALAEYGEAGEGLRGDPGIAEHERIPVRSPIAGTVLSRSVTQGRVVGTSDSLYVISDLSSLWMHAQVPESHLSAIRRGQRIEFSVRAYAGETFVATVERVADSLDPRTRTVDVRCRVDNRSQGLKPEMYATILLPVAENPEAVSVPAEAVQNVDGEDVVFVAESELRFIPRRVRVGGRNGGRVEIVEGLEAGERIAVQGSFLLKSELLKSRIEDE